MGSQPAVVGEVPSGGKEKEEKEEEDSDEGEDEVAPRISIEFPGKKKTTESGEQPETAQGKVGGSEEANNDEVGLLERGPSGVARADTIFLITRSLSKPGEAATSGRRTPPRIATGSGLGAGPPESAPESRTASACDTTPTRAGTRCWSESGADASAMTDTGRGTYVYRDSHITVVQSSLCVSASIATISAG